MSLVALPRGQALVEFAIVAFVSISSSRESSRSANCSMGQSLQPAADVAASELARIPLPATASLYDVSTAPIPRTPKSAAKCSTRSICMSI